MDDTRLREVARWCVTKAYEFAGLADPPWTAPALATLHAGDPLPSPFADPATASAHFEAERRREAPDRASNRQGVIYSIGEFDPFDMGPISRPAFCAPHDLRGRKAGPEAGRVRGALRRLGYIPGRCTRTAWPAPGGIRDRTRPAVTGISESTQLDRRQPHLLVIRDASVSSDHKTPRFLSQHLNMSEFCLKIRCLRQCRFRIYLSEPPGISKIFHDTYPRNSAQKCPFPQPWSESMPDHRGHTYSRSPPSPFRNPKKPPSRPPQALGAGSCHPSGSPAALRSAQTSASGYGVAARARTDALNSAIHIVTSRKHEHSAPAVRHHRSVLS